MKVVVDSLQRKWSRVWKADLLRTLLEISCIWLSALCVYLYDGVKYLIQSMHYVSKALKFCSVIEFFISKRLGCLQMKIRPRSWCVLSRSLAHHRPRLFFRYNMRIMIIQIIVNYSICSQFEAAEFSEFSDFSLSLLVQLHIESMA